MNPTPTTILYGQLDFPITLPKETPRRGSLDTVEQTFQTSRREAFQLDDSRSGRISRFPGYSTMFIDEIAREEEIPGLAYEQRLKGLGLLNGRDKIVSDPISSPEESWDTGEHEVYTVNPERYVLKQPHPLIPSLYITDRTAESEIGNIKKLRLSYKGIVPVEVDGLGNPVPKGYKRKIGTSGYTQQTTAPVGLYYYAPGIGWVLESPSWNYRFDASRLSVTDSYLSFTAPTYDRIPGNWQPPGMPSSITTGNGLELITPPGAAVDPAFYTQSVKNRPWGWVLKSYNVDQLFDLPVWLYTLTAEWVNEEELKI